MKVGEDEKQTSASANTPQLYKDKDFKKCKLDASSLVACGWVSAEGTLSEVFVTEFKLHKIEWTERGDRGNTKASRDFKYNNSTAKKMNNLNNDLNKE